MLMAGSLNVVKMSILPKLMFRLNAVSIKHPTDTVYLSFTSCYLNLYEAQKNRLAKIFSKKTSVRSAFTWFSIKPQQLREASRTSRPPQTDLRVHCSFVRDRAVQGGKGRAPQQRVLRTLDPRGNRETGPLHHPKREGKAQSCCR